jgi:hypothetical protein
MRPSLATPGLLVQLVCLGCGPRLLRGYINGPRGWICRRLASAAACGVAIAATNHATWWDDPGNPPGDSCVPPLTCVPVGRAPGSSSCVHMGGVPPSCGPLSSSCVSTPCKKSKSMSSKLIKLSYPPVWSSMVESGVSLLPT